jgi:hypothetical protein
MSDNHSVSPTALFRHFTAKWLVVVSALAFAGCSPPAPSALPLPKDLLGDLATSPELIFDEKFGPENVSLDGIVLGAPESSIPKDKIKETNKYGWRMFESGARFLVKDGKVAKLALGGDLLNSLEIETRKQLFDKLGQPDESKKESFAIQYHFKDRGIVADWMEVVDVLTIIRISKLDSD